MARWPGKVFKRVPDVADAGAQPRGHLTGRELFGDGELADGLQVDAGGVTAGQCQASAALGGALPGQRLIDAQPGEVAAGVGAQHCSQRGGQGGGEFVVAAAVTGRAER